MNEAGFDSIVYIILALAGLAYRFYMKNKNESSSSQTSSNSKQNTQTKLKEFDLDDLFGQSQKPVEQKVEINKYDEVLRRKIKQLPKEEYSDREIYSTLQKYNNDIPTTVEKLRRDAIFEENKVLDTNKKGRYNIYSVKSKQNNKVKAMLNSKDELKNAFILSEVLAKKF